MQQGHQDPQVRADEPEPEAQCLASVIADARTTRQGHVAIELQWSSYEDDDGLCSSMLELHLVHRVPGTHHSELSTRRLRRFEAEQLDDRREAHRVAAAVAAALGVPLHAPPVDERGGRDGSSFLRAAAPGAPSAYELTWEATWWTTDGRRHSTSATETIVATSGEGARNELAERLERHLHRPAEFTVRGSASGSASRMLLGTLPDEPAPEILRSTARADPRASVVARAFPDVRPIALMLGFVHAFGDGIKRYEPLGSWRAGELDDDVLDTMIDLAGCRSRWERTFVLQETFAAGRSVAAFLRGECERGVNLIELIINLREAFPMGLQDAKEYIHDAARGADDAALDARLGAG